MTFKLSAPVYRTLGLIDGKLKSLTCTFVSFMCSPVEGHRRTETSHFLIKSLELKCHVHIL